MAKSLTKHEFGKRLNQLMNARGWHQSELARRADVSRDRISTYIRGVSLPEAGNLEKLAKALDVQPSDLLPKHTVNAIANDLLSLEMKIAQSDPEVAWLRINRQVSTVTCIKIVELLSNDKLPQKE